MELSTCRQAPSAVRTAPPLSCKARHFFQVVVRGFLKRERQLPVFCNGFWFQLREIRIRKWRQDKDTPAQFDEGRVSGLHEFVEFVTLYLIPATRRSNADGQ